MKEIRRLRLKNLLAGKPYYGDRQKFLADSGITKGRLAQLLNDKEPFGDVAGRNLAESLGLGGAYFDAQEAVVDVLDDWRLQASPTSLTVIDGLTMLAQMNKLSEQDWAQIHTFILKFGTRQFHETDSTDTSSSERARRISDKLDLKDGKNGDIPDNRATHKRHA